MPIGGFFFELDSNKYSLTALKTADIPIGIRWWIAHIQVAGLLWPRAHVCL